MTQNKTYLEKMIDLRNAISELKHNILVALPFIDAAKVTRKLEAIKPFPIPYCYDVHGICEDNEVCYCNRIICPKIDCEQLLPSDTISKNEVQCRHCKSIIKLIS